MTTREKIVETLGWLSLLVACGVVGYVLLSLERI